MPRIVSNSEIVTRPITSTSSVLERAMDQHLVDHDLEEQRRDQRKKLQEERGDQNLAEEAAIFVDGAEEPGDVEAPREVEQPGAPRHQDEATVPSRLELGPRHQHWACGQRVLHQDLILAGLAEKEKAAVAADGDVGKRRLRQSLPKSTGTRAL